MTRPMRNSSRNYSLGKAKIKFLLLEGLHARARKIIESAGYTNIALEVASKLVRYSDNGTTRSAVNFPLVKIPATIRTRILH